MSDNGNKKVPEALADEALDKVAGGGHSWASETPDLDELFSEHECSNCHRSVSGNDAYKRAGGAWFCKTCWYQLSGW